MPNTPFCLLHLGLRVKEINTYFLIPPSSITICLSCWTCVSLSLLSMPFYICFNLRSLSRPRPCALTKVSTHNRKTATPQRDLTNRWFRESCSSLIAVHVPLPFIGFMMNARAVIQAAHGVYSHLYYLVCSSLVSILTLLCLLHQKKQRRKYFIYSFYFQVENQKKPS